MQSLRCIREKKGVSKVAVARHIGVTDKTYAKYEDAPEKMTIETAKSVAEFLGVDVSEIFFLSNSN